MFDRSASDAEHLQIFLHPANPGFSGHFLATITLFGFILPNAAPTVMRAALRGLRIVGTAIMATDDTRPPLALRPREAARTLSVSPRTLWEWTRVGIIPCVRVGTGKRRTVLYPVADLQAWLARQTDAANGGNNGTP